MKKIILSLVIIWQCALLAAQQSMPSPVIRVSNIATQEEPIELSAVKIDIDVVGSLAVTTMEMTFLNPNNRTMEGELQFPLAEGQTISRFALDINGKMREGVPVEKARGQEVFESIVREGVDPGLLEMTEGNNFRTRIYPLPAKGERRVLIAYEQQLKKTENGFRIFMPVEFGGKEIDLALNARVYGNEKEPEVEESPWGTFAFNKANNVYMASYSEKRFKASGQLAFTVPVHEAPNIYIEKGNNLGETVFYAQLHPPIVKQEKELPKHITIYWDASLSRNTRSAEMEKAFLDLYFQKIRNVKVDLVTFNCWANKEQAFEVTGGNWEKLRAALESVVYDGATQLGSLNLQQITSDEALLFSDGLSNIGKAIPMTGTKPVSVINSSIRANFDILKYISSKTGGKYVNLMNQQADEVVGSLFDEDFRLISIDYDNLHVSDINTSSSASDSTSVFAVSGKLIGQNTSLVLNFGIGNKVSYSRTIDLSTAKAANYSNIVQRMWAQMRIADLSLVYDQNKDEIGKIGKKYNLVTRNTSLIVLEDVRDYIRFDVAPPAELQEEYNRLKIGLKQLKREENSNRTEEMLEIFEERKAWWNSKFPKTAELTISGKVLGKNNEPLRNAYVRIEGRRGHDYTDSEGGFTIKASKGDVLSCEASGYKPASVKVKSESVTIKLKKQPKPKQKPGNSTYISGYKIDKSSIVEEGYVIGQIVDEQNEPIIAAQISLEKKPGLGTITDFNGRFKIRAELSDVLLFSYLGYETQRIPVMKIDGRIRVQMAAKQGIIEEFVMTAAGSQRKFTTTGAISGIAVEALDNPASSVAKSLADIVPGIISRESIMPQTHEIPEFEIGKDMLILIDGVEGKIEDIDHSNVESYAMLRDASTTAIYGSRAANGVFLVTTKKGAEQFSGISLRKWQSDAPYITALKKQNSPNLYAAYLSLRDEYISSPFFYLDVATLFEERGLKQETFIILSNLVEMEAQNYRWIRVLAHRMLQLGHYEDAVTLFEKVLELRPEEPQSYRDLALAQAKVKNYQKAIELLYQICEKEWDNRFDGIEPIVLGEINALIAEAKREKVKLDLTDIDSRLIYNMPVDVRIVLNWDTDNSDMDLWVTDPFGEKCYYNNSRTRIGGMMSDDFTGGYGPEEFMIREAVKGKYKIEAEYYASREQTLIGATTIYLDIYTRYATGNEKKETITLRLDKDEDRELYIGEINFR